MNTCNKQTDPLYTLFRQLPEERLPESFRSTMLERVLKESSRRKKRNERFALVAVIVASLLMIVFGGLVLVYMEAPEPTVSLSIPNVLSFKSFSFYAYIGILSLLLLLADYKIRKLYKERNSGE
ncbi:MAG: hypothetical protein LBV74_04955 [Tannerella sp.]|jgi:cell division septal protein FtsQ|nr:hypothetical protein [Tannerella sp.]